MSEPEKEIEKKYTYDREKLVELLKTFIDGLKDGTVGINDEEVQVPDSGLDVEYGFKIENGQSEIEIEIKWREG